MLSHWGPRSFAAVVVVLSSVACSDDDPPDEKHDGNVDFSSACSIPAPCGGDPTGEWTVVGGCVQPSAEDYDCNWQDSAYGDVSGTVSFQSGSFSSALESQLSHCDTLDFSSSGLGGNYTVTGTEIVGSSTTFAFCVDGDSMLLWDRAATSPDMSVLELVRSGS